MPRPLHNLSIYHLHIPRTAGIYVKNNILPHLITGGIDHFVSNRTYISTEQIKRSRFVGGHFGLMPLKHMNDPAVFCLVRDPVDRLISYFKYTTGPIRAGKEAEEKLESWLYGEQSQVQSNLQSKFLTGSMNIDKFNQGVTQLQGIVGRGWDIEDYSLDMDDIKANIDRFYCYTMDNVAHFKEDLNKALMAKFGFTTFKRDYKANESYDVGVVFTKKHRDRIIDLNSIDMEMYEYVRATKKRY